MLKTDSRNIVWVWCISSGFTHFNFHLTSWILNKILMAKSLNLSGRFSSVQCRQNRKPFNRIIMVTKYPRNETNLKATKSSILLPFPCTDWMNQNMMMWMRTIVKWYAMYEPILFVTLSAHSPSFSTFNVTKCEWSYFETMRSFSMLKNARNCCFRLWFVNFTTWLNWKKYFCWTTISVRLLNACVFPLKLRWDLWHEHQYVWSEKS